MKRNLPTFLIIGAHKAGTTSLYHYLKQHPEIFLPDTKEPLFFAYGDKELNLYGADAPSRKEAYNSLKEYVSLFKNADSFSIRGEASTVYHYSSHAPQKIKGLIPNAKLIMILRHPVQRAFSNYLYALRDGRESEIKFRKAIEKEKKRIENNWGPLWHYKQRGLYGKQIERYSNYFDRSQFRFFLFEDFKENQEKVYKSICEFIGVEKKIKPNFNLNYNQSGIPKSKALQNFLTSSHPLKKGFALIPKSIKSKIKQKLMSLNLSRTSDSVPQLSDQVYNQLLNYYEEDIRKLQSLIDRDLAGWLKKR